MASIELRSVSKSYDGGVHAVRRDVRGAVEAAGDPRRAGVVRTS